MQLSRRLSIVTCILAACCLVGLSACVEKAPVEAEPSDPVAEPAVADAPTPDEPPRVAERVLAPAPAPATEAATHEKLAVAPKPAAEAAPPPSARPKPDTKEPPSGKVSVGTSGNSEPRPFAEVKQEWVAYFEDAKKHYDFTEEQGVKAQAVFDQCLSRAEARVEKFEVAQKDAGGDVDENVKRRDFIRHNRAMQEMTDELMGRIDALVTFAQIQGALKQGYESPVAKKKPKPLVVGNPAPSWKLAATDGELLSLEGFEGKVVLMHFWASWCGYCKRAVPEIQKIHETFKDNPDVVVLGINCRERAGSKVKPSDFVKEKGLTYRQAFKGDTVANLYEVKGFPTMYIIGPDGKIIHYERGFKKNPAERLIPVIEQALKGRQAAGAQPAKKRT